MLGPSALGWLGPWPSLGRLLSSPVHYRICRGIPDVSMFGPSACLGLRPWPLHESFLWSPLRSRTCRTVAGGDMFGPWPSHGSSSWVLYIVRFVEMSVVKAWLGLPPLRRIRSWLLHGSFHFVPVHFRTYNLVSDLWCKVCSGIPSLYGPVFLNPLFCRVWRFVPDLWGMQELSSTWRVHGSLLFMGVWPWLGHKTLAVSWHLPLVSWTMRDVQI